MDKRITLVTGASQGLGRAACLALANAGHHVIGLARSKKALESLDDEFPVLFFKVAGLTIAVPLVSLGGIVKLERVNHIMGRPDWYTGVQTHRGAQLNVVDTCAWVMPEKYDSALAETVNYQYVVL